MSNPQISLNVDSTIGPPINLSGVDVGMTIADLKSLIATAGGVPPDLDEMFRAPDPVPLDDSESVSNYLTDGDTVQVVARSGVVTYDMTLALAPPPFADQLAHLRQGAVLSQTVAGIVGGSTYQLGFYVQGSVVAAIQYLDAGAAPIGTVASISPSHITDEQLTAFTLDSAAPVGAASALISFTATSPALFLDVVSFNTI